MFSLIIVAVLVSCHVAGWNWQKSHANAGVVDVVWAFGMMFAVPVCADRKAPLF